MDEVLQLYVEELRSKDLAEHEALRAERNRWHTLQRNSLTLLEQLQAERDVLALQLAQARKVIHRMAMVSESQYHAIRQFIDDSVPDWVRGDDWPVYPLLRLAKLEKDFLAAPAPRADVVAAGLALAEALDTEALLDDTLWSQELFDDLTAYRAAKEAAK